MTKNYALEEIPSPQTLIEKAQKIADDLSDYSLYSFSELFTEVLNKKKIVEYHRNNDVWGNELSYNTWSKKYYNDDEIKEQAKKKQNEVKGIYILYE